MNDDELVFKTASLAPPSSAPRAKTPSAKSEDKGDKEKEAAYAEALRKLSASTGVASGRLDAEGATSRASSEVGSDAGGYAVNVDIIVGNEGAAGMSRNLSNTDLAHILGMVNPGAGGSSASNPAEAELPDIEAPPSWKPPEDLPPSIEGHLPPVPPCPIAQNTDVALDMQVDSMMGGGQVVQEKDMGTILKEAAERAKAARELLADNPSFQEGERPAASGVEIEGNGSNAKEREAPEMTSKYSGGTDDIGAYFSSSFQRQIGGAAQVADQSIFAKYATAPRVREREEEECKVDVSNQTFAERRAETKDEESEDSEGSSLFGDDDEDSVEGGAGQPTMQSDKMQWQPPEGGHVELDDLFGDDDDDDDAVDGGQAQGESKMEDSDDDSSLFGSSDDDGDKEEAKEKIEDIVAQPGSQPPATSEMKPQATKATQPSSKTFASVEDAKKHLKRAKKPQIAIFEPPKATEENESEYESSDDGSVFSLTDRDDEKKAKKKKPSKSGGLLGGLLSKISSKGRAKGRDEASFGQSGYTIKKKTKESSGLEKRKSTKLIQAMRPPEKYWDDRRAIMGIEKEPAIAREDMRGMTDASRRSRDQERERQRQAKASTSFGSEAASSAAGQKKVTFAPDDAGDGKRMGKSARAMVASNKASAVGRSAAEDEDWQQSHKEKEWEKTFATMRQYMKRTGGCDVPEGHTLFQWVGRQRRMCRKFVRESDPAGEMTGKNLQRYVHVYRLERVGFDWGTAVNRGLVRDALATGSKRLSPSQRESLGMRDGSPKKGDGRGSTGEKRKGFAKPSRNQGSVFDSISSKRDRSSGQRMNSASSDEEEFEFKEGPKSVSMSDSSGEDDAAGSKSRKRQRSSVEEDDNGGFIDDGPGLLAWNEAPKRLQKKRRRGQIAVLSDIPAGQWVNMMVELNRRLSVAPTPLPEGGERRWSNLERAVAPTTTYVVRHPSSPKRKKNIKTTSNGSSSPLRMKARTPLKAKTKSSKVLQAGERVFAAWWKGRNRANAPYYYPGVVASHKVLEGKGRSGPTLVYDVHFDDGDKLAGINWRLVIPRKKYLKKSLKPLLKVGDEVYSAWWSDRSRGAAPSWHPGVIANRRQRDYGGPYGPIRLYDIVFDDGDELEAVQDCFVMKREDYLLSVQKSVEDYEVGDDDSSDNGEPKWMGVRNKLDKLSIKEDMWARDVGWYVVTIDGKERSFSLLSSALRAYDAYTVRRKGAGTKESDLNLPQEWAFPSPPGACAPVHTGDGEQNGEKSNTKGQAKRSTKSLSSNKAGAAAPATSSAKAERMPSDDLPEGWTVREHKRANSSQVDRYFYSPKGRQFRSKKAVRLFLDCLDGTNGDEAEAFKGSAKAATSVGDAPSKSKTSQPHNDASENVTLAELAGTRATTKAIQSIIDSSKAETASPDKTANDATADAVDAPLPASASKEADHSSEPSDEFLGWTVEKITRPKGRGARGSHVDKYYYSPKEGYKFRSKLAVRRFLECLEESNGDEALALEAFEGSGKTGKPKPKESSVEAKSGEANGGYKSDGSRFSDVSEDAANDQMAVISFGGTRSTTKAIHDLIDLTKDPETATMQTSAARNDGSAASSVVEAKKESKPAASSKGLTLKEKEARYPAKPSDEFIGFTVREIPRGKGSQAKGTPARDRYWYSPKLGHRFRSKLEVRRFLQCLENNNDDEAAALKAFCSSTKVSKDAPKLATNAETSPKVIEYISPSHTAQVNGEKVGIGMEGKAVAKKEDSNQSPAVRSKYSKPLIGKGEKIFARWSGPGGNGSDWFPGRVWEIRETPGGEYGPVKRYDVVFDDGDTESNVDEVFVTKKAEYEMCVKKPEGRWIGVRNVRFPDANDEYARLIGWYVASIGGKEQVFAMLSDALRAYDAHTVRCKKAATQKTDLNLPEEWVFPTPPGACSPVHMQQ